MDQNQKSFRAGTMLRAAKQLGIRIRAGSSSTQQANRAAPLFDTEGSWRATHTILLAHNVREILAKIVTQFSVFVSLNWGTKQDQQAGFICSAALQTCAALSCRRFQAFQ